MQGEQKQQKSKGKRVGAYELGKMIGKGTFAAVREAIHLPTQEQVAIKILHKGMIVDSRDKTNVSREMRIVKKIRHPNVVQLLQIMQTSSKLYLVMEHVKGGELYELIVNSPMNRLDEATANRYFQQLINTVQYLHSLGITHRDIKPQNIMIGDHEDLKLIDFGLSNLYSFKQELHTPCGSPCYAAPEMLSKNTYSPLKGDVWSCGIVLYTMLCGFLPFQHQNTVQLYRLVEKGIYDEPAHLSTAARDLLRRMLKVDPEARLSILEIRQHPFCQRNIQPVVKGLLPSQKIYLDSDVIEQMKTLAYSGFIKDVQENLKNQNTAAFYLLLFKKLNNLKVSHVGYYEKMIEVKTPFKSQSLLIKQIKNPEEHPTISRNNILSLINISRVERQRGQTTIQSVASMNLPRRSINMRIKKILR